MFNRSGSGNYAYTSARVKSKQSKLLKAEDYNKMLMMTVPEISHYISDAGYGKEMSDLANRHEGLSLLEYATYANMAKAFRSILNSATGELANMVRAYLSRWDFENVKTILRGKNYGLPVEEIREDLVPAGNLDMDALDKLLSAGTVEDVLDQFRTVSHVSVPDAAVAKYRDGKVLTDIEDFFVREYYKRLVSSITGKDRGSTIFRNYVKAAIDAKNVETALKLKAAGVPSEKIMEYYIPKGGEVDEKTMSQIASADSVQAALNEMQSLRMYSDIKDVIGEDPTVVTVVGAMSKYRIDLANKVGHMYPLSVVPVVTYMIHKEIEVRNIRTIAHGIDSGLDRDTLKSLVVV